MSGKKRDFFNMVRYINEFKFVTFDPFSPTLASQQIFIFIFFPPTRQKYASRDLLTLKYTERGLIVNSFLLSVNNKRVIQIFVINYDVDD